MLCPSCGYDNIEGADRCEECLTPLLNLDVPRPDTAAPFARTVMEDDLRQLDQEFLGVPPETSVSKVIAAMKEARLGCALVIEGGKLCGIFTERDVLKKVSGNNANSDDPPVRKLMSPNPEFLHETDSVATALNKMSMGRYRHLPVEKSDGSYCVTSVKHVLKYIAREEW